MANSVHDYFGRRQPPFHITGVLETLYNEDIIDLQILQRSDLGSCHGLTLLGESTILLREDVYDGARAGNGRDRGTLAHELGHFVLHEKLAGLARSMPGEAIRTFEDPEWQACCFQGELLVPARWIEHYRSADQVAELCLVSVDAARYQLKRYKEAGLYRGDI